MHMLAASVRISMFLESYFRYIQSVIFDGFEWNNIAWYEMPFVAIT